MRIFLCSVKAISRRFYWRHVSARKPATCKNANSDGISSNSELNNPQATADRSPTTKIKPDSVLDSLLFVKITAYGHSKPTEKSGCLRRRSHRCVHRLFFIQEGRRRHTCRTIVNCLRSIRQGWWVPCPRLVRRRASLFTRTRQLQSPPFTGPRTQRRGIVRLSPRYHSQPLNNRNGVIGSIEQKIWPKSSILD